MPLIYHVLYYILSKSLEKKTLFNIFIFKFLVKFCIDIFLKDLNPIRFYLKNHSFKVPKRIFKFSERRGFEWALAFIMSLVTLEVLALTVRGLAFSLWLIVTTLFTLFSWYTKGDLSYLLEIIFLFSWSWTTCRIFLLIDKNRHMEIYNFSSRHHFRHLFLRKLQYNQFYVFVPMILMLMRSVPLIIIFLLLSAYP